MLNENAISIAHELSNADVFPFFHWLNLTRIGEFNQPQPLKKPNTNQQGVLNLDGMPLSQTAPDIVNLDKLPTEVIHQYSHWKIITWLIDDELQKIYRWLFR